MTETLNQFNLQTNMFPKGGRIIVAGASGTGKSSLMIRILQNREQFFNYPIKKIVWATGNANYAPKLLSTIPGVDVVEGIPNFESIPEGSVVILDDLQFSRQLDRICEIVTCISRHAGVTVFFLVQNIFYGDRHMRSISLNASAYLLLKSNRDVNQIKVLGRQIFGSEQADFLKCYISSTALPYSCLMIDLSIDLNPVFKIKSDIFNKNYYSCYTTQQLLDQFCSPEIIDGQKVYTTHTVLQ